MVLSLTFILPLWIRPTRDLYSCLIPVAWIHERTVLPGRLVSPLWQPTERSVCGLAMALVSFVMASAFPL